MDAVTTIRPATGVAPTDYARPVVAAVQGATTTDLPDSKAVTPSGEGTATKEVQQQTNSYISRGFVIDPQSREVIYRVMDTRTRQVLWQVPDAALLRSRAYAQTLSGGTQPATPATLKNVEG